jgi:hypothetical protein
MQEFSKKIEECIIASLWRTPESAVLDTPSLFKMQNENAPYEFMNGIYRTQLDGAELEAELHRQLDSFASKKLSFRWYAYPHSSPTDLQAHLKKLNPSAVVDSNGLYAEVNRFDLTIPQDVTVEELSHRNLQEYALANADGWSLSDAQADKVRREIIRDFESGTMAYRAFLARHQGIPASTGIFRIVNGDGYLIGGSTRPQFRGKGVYTGLVRHRIKALKEQGIKMALVLARADTSSPICETIGFEVGCKCRAYSFSFF